MDEVLRLILNLLILWSCSDGRTNCRPCSLHLSPIISLFLRRDVNKELLEGKLIKELDMGLKYHVLDQSLY